MRTASMVEKRRQQNREAQRRYRQKWGTMKNQADLDNQETSRLRKRVQELELQAENMAEEIARLNRHIRGMEVKKILDDSLVPPAAE